MSDNGETTTKPVFDPNKLEQVEVAKDYPMEQDEFDMLFNEYNRKMNPNSNLNIGVVVGAGQPRQTALVNLDK